MQKLKSAHKCAFQANRCYFRAGNGRGASAGNFRLIEVKNSADDEWLVTVKGAVTTHHRVRVTKAEMDRLAHGRSAEELLQESFRFLLEREPNTSILPSFGLLLIGRYFPEYEREIRARLGNRE